MGDPEYMKNILIVSYLFPPLHSAESLLVARTVKGLSRYEWGINVLTVKEDCSLDMVDENLLKDIPRHIQITRSYSPERIIFSTPVIRSMISRFLNVAGITEKQYLWMYSALRIGKKIIENNKIEIIYSRASYNISNLVGLELKRATGLPWVAHFSDPWVDNPYWINFITNKQEKKQKLFEEAVIRQADTIVFTTKKTADLVMNKYPRYWKNKVHVIPHGFDEGILKIVQPQEISSSKLKFLYTGSFYPEIRTPVEILKAIKYLKETKRILSDVQFDFIGANCEIYQQLADNMGLSDTVIFQGQKSYSESVKLTTGANILLLIDSNINKDSIFLPSKLIDYLMFKKPILGITPLKGESAELLRRLQCPVVSPDNIEGIADAIYKLIVLWKKGSLRVSAEYDQVSKEYENSMTSKMLDYVLRSNITNYSS